MRVLILEDNRDRRVAMIGRMADRFPFIRVIFFDVSADMIEFMKSEPLDDVALMSIDHDLELIPGPNYEWIDPGTGLDVVRWLVQQPQPICPVVVHTTNCPAGDQMMQLLQEAQWNVFRVVPHDDLGWIDGDWFRLVRNAIVHFAPARIATQVAFGSSKIGLLRSLLDNEYESGLEFSKAAVSSIVDAYQRDLRHLLGEATVEFVSLMNEDTLVSALEVEGPIVQWVNKVGFSPRAFLSEVAGRGPLARNQLQIEANTSSQLAERGVEYIRVEFIDIADRQALLVVSAAGRLTATPVSAIIDELKHALEIAVFVGVVWRRSAARPLIRKPELTRKEET